MSTPIRRNPIVFVKNLIAVEIVALLIYASIAAIADYGVLYSQLPLTNYIPYGMARLLTLGFIEIFLTLYIFGRWIMETFTFSPDQVLHERGILLRKKTVTTLSRTRSVTVAQGLLGKRLHYGQLTITNGNAQLLQIADISNPNRIASIILGAAPEPLTLTTPIVTLEQLLNTKEHEKLEFKTSLRYDHRSKQVNKDLEKVAMKTIAAFLNSDGGHLVIGVDDANTPVGLTADYGTLRKVNADGFENHFTQIFNNMIGPEYRHNVKLAFHPYEDKELCVVNVSRSDKPAYLKSDEGEAFFIRTGNTTTPLKLSEVEPYVRSRFNNNHIA